MADLTSLMVELTGESGQELSTTSFTHDSAKTVRTWFVGSAAQPVNTVDIPDSVRAIIGYTEYGPGPYGRMTRHLPIADPAYPWLYASKITSLRGIGTYGKVANAVPLETGTGTFPDYTLWTQYAFTVESEMRPYPVTADSTITAQPYTWFPETNGGTVASSGVYYPEWQRFCDWDFLPLDEYVTQQRGGATFSTGTGTVPNNSPFQGSPRLFVPNQIFRMLWVGVPLRYVTSPNSYLQKWRGRINQNGWNGPMGPTPIPAGAGAFFPPGSLLYMGYKPTKYQPPIAATYAPYFVGVDYSKLCNIELTFLYTSRVGTDLPPQPSNRNFVLTGHNDLPYFPKRQFFYTQFKDNTGTVSPMFYSFPLELLFTDPDTGA